jgi:hypothetical protein
MKYTVLRILNWFSSALLLATVAGAVFYVAKARFDSNAVSRAIFTLLTAFIPFALSVGKSMLDQLRRTQELILKPTAIALRSPEKLYQSVASALNQASEEHGPKMLRHAVLHGHVGQERIVPNRRERFYARFDNEMIRCIKASGANSWEVRQLYLVASERRLDITLERLAKSRSHARNYSVKVFVPPFTLPYLSLMVIDKRSAYLAVDDVSMYRVKSAVEISGPEAVAVLSDYFDSLWLNSSAVEIRAVNRLNEAAIASVRAQLRSASQQHHTADA